MNTIEHFKASEKVNRFEDSPPPFQFALGHGAIPMGHESNDLLEGMKASYRKRERGLSIKVLIIKIIIGINTICNKAK